VSGVTVLQTEIRSPTDDLLALVAIGLLAYASADIAHHVAGHGGMCLAVGGRVRSLSSTFVDCTVRGAAVDLAGPFANLIVGLLAWAAALHAQRAARLFLTLACGFNLLWFSLQLVFSAVTRTDDFAWPMVAFHVSESLRYALIASGIVLYVLSVRILRHLLMPFGPAERARRIVWTAWLTAGVFACFTALVDPHRWHEIAHHAAPQSLALSVGLLFVPKYIQRSDAPPVARSAPWLLAAIVVAVASLMLLGPGFAI
jgi:hypothetical protein